MKSKAKIKLFRGDQLLIPGTEDCFNIKTFKVECKIKRKRTGKKPCLARAAQLSLLSLTPCDTSGTI